MLNQQLPTGRYGSRTPKPSRPTLRIALIATALLAGLVVAVVAYRNLGSAPIDGQQTLYSRLDDHSLRVTIEVQRDNPHRPADCVVRAMSKDGQEVGRKEVYVPPSDDTIRLDTVVRTSNTPASGDVYGCTYNVPEYLSTHTRPTG